MSYGSIDNKTYDSGTPCDKCGTSYVFTHGECVTCSRVNVRKAQNKNSNMELINRRRKMEKEKELKDIDNDIYFED